MARNQGPPTTEDDSQFYRGGREEDEGRRVSKRESSALDERIADLDEDDDSRFLRGEKRVPVRKGALPRKTATRLRWILLWVVVIAALVGTFASAQYYLRHSWRFRIESSDLIAVSGAEHVSRGEILTVFGDDISKNIFSVDLNERRRKLEDISWVESAAVMRILPNKLRVEIRERVPVAYVQLGSQVALIDANGVIMNVPQGAQGSYSFPVIIRMSETEPLSTRAPRMKTYMQLISELDAGGAHYSQDLNEVDLSDPNDVRVTVADASGAILIHLGERQREGIFLDRYRIYKAHLQEWRQQYPRLNSVDLRYDEQVVLEPAASAAPADATTAPTQATPVPVKPAKHAAAPKKQSRKR